MAAKRQFGSTYRPDDVGSQTAKPAMAGSKKLRSSNAELIIPVKPTSSSLSKEYEGLVGNVFHVLLIGA